jgi:hypothetical protein
MFVPRICATKIYVLVIESISIVVEYFIVSAFTFMFDLPIEITEKIRKATTSDHNESAEDKITFV